MFSTYIQYTYTTWSSISFSTSIRFTSSVSCQLTYSDTFVITYIFFSYFNFLQCLTMMSIATINASKTRADVNYHMSRKTTNYSLLTVSYIVLGVDRRPIDKLADHFCSGRCKFRKRSNMLVLILSSHFRSKVIVTF